MSDTSNISDSQRDEWRQKIAAILRANPYGEYKSNLAEKIGAPRRAMDSILAGIECAGILIYEDDLGRVFEYKRR